MKILLLTQVVPNPPDSGPKIKTNAVLRYLAQGHDVHLVSFVRSDAEVAAARQLESLCRSVTTVPLRRSRVKDLVYLVRSLLRGTPFLVERDGSAEMRRVLRELTARERFDAVHADQLTMGQFALDLPVRLRVLDEHNAVWTIVRRSTASTPALVRPFVELEWRKLRAYEGQLCARFDCVSVVSEEDRRALEGAAGGPFNSVTIPIAIDTRALEFKPRTSAARHVVSVATMFYPPNVEGILWFARTALARVTQSMPGTRFLIVGSRPPTSVKELAQDRSGIEVTGYVADLEPLLEQARVLVVPVHSGSGMRVKILEAFARGIPVVSTAIGVEGIDARHGEHLLVADEPAAFADAVALLLKDDRLAARLAAAGRTLVETQYDWRTALQALDDIYPAARFEPVEGVA